MRRHFSNKGYLLLSALLALAVNAVDTWARPPVQIQSEAADSLLAERLRAMAEAALSALPRRSCRRTGRRC